MKSSSPNSTQRIRITVNRGARSDRSDGVLVAPAFRPAVEVRLQAAVAVRLKPDATTM